MKENVPEDFPAFTLGVQRALCTVSLLFPSKLAPCLDALYQAYWVDGITKIGEPEVFMPVLQKVLGDEMSKEILKTVS